MGELWISVVITFLFVIIHTACGQMHLKIISTDHKTGKEMTSYYTIDDKALGFELAQDAGGSTQIKVPGTLEIPDEFISAWISDIMPNNIIPKDEHYTNQIESINTHFKCTVQQTRLDAKVESVSVHVTLTNEQDTILNVDVSNLSKGNTFPKKQLEISATNTEEKIFPHIFLNFGVIDETKSYAHRFVIGESELKSNDLLTELLFDEFSLILFGFIILFYFITISF